MSGYWHFARDILFVEITRLDGERRKAMLNGTIVLPGVTTLVELYFDIEQFIGNNATSLVQRNSYIEKYTREKIVVVTY